MVLEINLNAQETLDLISGLRYYSSNIVYGPDWLIEWNCRLIRKRKIPH